MNAQARSLMPGLAIVALSAPMIAFAVLRFQPALDPTIMASTFHFYVVGFTALIAALACGVVIASARTLRETRLLFLGLAFFAIAGIFAVHGLNTPGFIADQYYASVGVSAWLSIAAGSVFVAGSVVALPERFEHLIERNGRAFFAVAVTAIFAYIIVSFTIESWLDWVPIQEVGVQLGLGLPCMALIGFAIWRYYQAYLFARLPSQVAMAIALVILLEVQAIILWGRVWNLSWWFYHGLYAIAFVVLFTGWAMEVRRSGTLRAIADALSMRDALAQLNRGLDDRILELVDAVEIKDLETFGHVRRVAGYALGIGRRIGLSPGELRALALAAQMHDVGKISVPNSILAKPGPLTEEEYGILKEHTVRGHAIARQVPALRPIADVVRHHHERFDGSGYPDGLAGDEIPLLSRIIAVADTYDAITSKRPYRESRGHDEALAEIRRVRGEQFDPQVVDAFVAFFAESGAPRAVEQAAA